jgi:hypothetical protein
MMKLKDEPLKFVSFVRNFIYMATDDISHLHSFRMITSRVKCIINLELGMLCRLGLELSKPQNRQCNLACLYIYIYIYIYIQNRICLNRMSTLCAKLKSLVSSNLTCCVSVSHGPEL